MSVSYRVGIGGSGTVALPGTVSYLGDIPGWTERADGTYGTTGCTLQDPGGTLSFYGLNKWQVEESDAAWPRIFNGIVTERRIKRGPFDRTDVHAVWDLDVIDLNGYLHLRVIRDGNHGNRPAETDVDRVTWLIDEVLQPSHVRNGTPGSYFGENGPTAGVIAGPRMLDAADYRGQHADEVLADFGPPGNRRFFCYYDPTLDEVCLFYGLNTEHLGDSDLRISNVIGDQDADTFYPYLDAELDINPEDVNGGVLYIYKSGTKRLYREDPATIGTFLDRSIAITNDKVGSDTTASTFTDRLLGKMGTERYAISVTIRLPKERLNDVVPGQRMEVKFTHLPGVESFTFFHVISRTIAQDFPNKDFYTVRLELSDYIGGVGTGGSGGGGPFVPGNTAPISLVYKEHAYIATGNTTPYTPAVTPGVGDLLVLIAATRNGSTDKLLAIDGWTIVESALETTSSPNAGLSMFYKISEPGDGTWLLANSAQIEISYSEWAGAANLVDSAAGTTTPGGSPYAVNGQSVTPPGGAQTLIISGFSVTMQNDTETMAGVPDTNVIELDDWATTPSVNGSPGRWSAYRIVDNPSGSYNASGVVTVNAAVYNYAGITAAFAGGSANSPGQAQEVTESTDGDGATDQFATNYAYLPGSLVVYVGGVRIVPTEDDPTLGTFTLPFPPATGTDNIFIRYQAADGTDLGTGNNPVPPTGTPTVPPEVLPTPVLDLDDLADVTITTPADGEVLTYDTGFWVNQAVSIPNMGLDDLNDVILTSPADGDRLRYDGSDWVNSTLTWEPMVDGTGLVMLDGLGNIMRVEVAY